jgi:hypothetical protein
MALVKEIKIGAASQIKVWRDDPLQFVRDNFKVEPDQWQADVLRVFPSQDANKMRISLQACAGPGKSAVLAWCGWNFLLCYGEKGDHPKGAAVSTTADNLKDNLWPEFSKWQSRSQLLMKTFTWTKERIFANDHPETWFLSARSWSKTASAEEQGRTLSGLHSGYVLVLIDESGDIPISVAKAGEQALSSCKWGKIMQAGNPTSLEGMLYIASTSQSNRWHIIVITGDPLDPKRSPRIPIAFAQEQIDLYGRDNPWVMSYILGKFPPTSMSSLLGMGEVQEAMARHLRVGDYEFAQKRVGTDVARFGDDLTVLAPRQGLWAAPMVMMRNARQNEIADRILLARSRWGQELDFVDGTGGYGAGVIDSLIQRGHSPIEVNFQSKADDSRYFNKRAEMWFRMAEWVKRGGALPKDDQLARELCAPTYFFSANGKLQLEEKKQIKGRLGFSPDKADALALTFAQIELPRTQADAVAAALGLGSQQNSTKHEWDPFLDGA